MKAEGTTPQCSAAIYGSGYRSAQCSRRSVTVEADVHGGAKKPFCKQHAPSNVEARRRASEQESNRKWNERRAADKRRMAILDAKEGVLVAVGLYAQECPNPVRAAYLKLEKVLAGRPS